VPGFGWAMDTLDFIFLNRDWDKDELMLTQRLQSWVDDKLLIWLFFFPEGTAFTSAKHARQLQWAADEHKGHGYKNLLIPRSKGFITCADILRPNLQALYDITICYGDEIRPTFATYFMGTSPRDTHLHIRRWTIDQIPKDQNELKAWLFNCYKEKDDLIEYFKIHKEFPTHISSINNPTEANSGKGIRQVLRNSKPYLCIWFFFWIIVAILWAYYIYISTLFKIIIAIGIVIHVSTSFSVFVRRLRGLEPWPTKKSINGEFNSISTPNGQEESLNNGLRDSASNGRTDSQKEKKNN